MSAAISARRIRVRGIVQGIGFRPHVIRLAHDHDLLGWVLNDVEGVSIHVEGPEPALEAFLHDLRLKAPPAAHITNIDVEATAVEAAGRFEIRDSGAAGRPTTRMSPDLPVCDDCLRELRDPADRRHGYPYINCTNCGPRFSIVRELPYDRARTTMAEWPLCAECAAEYHHPANRRFHAQPIACPACGPHYRLVRLTPDATYRRDVTDGAVTECVASAFRRTSTDAIREAAALLRDGCILAVKGIGGYHLACDADNAATIEILRSRKFRKDKPFAVMVRDLAAARRTVDILSHGEELLISPARPIVLAPARALLHSVAPDNHEIGVMLPYAPIHHLLFEAGAPERLVMTSGNRSSEPIAYQDEDACSRLGALADAMLVGERAIARRVDDSVVRAGALGPIVLRRSRGLTPAVVATLPTDACILALGGDLKNAITLVVEGQAYVSQHVGDLEHYESFKAFDQTIRDFAAMYDVPFSDLTIVHDRHPHYASTAHAESLKARSHVAVQHHRAHVASVLAERGEFQKRVVGVAFDGTGYGDDGSIWGGEVFVGSIRGGFERVAHLRAAVLLGGDAASREPVQAAAGFLASLALDIDLSVPPFGFPRRYRDALHIAQSGLRTFPTTSVGRLFDAVAALLGFTRPISFEGQAAMWVEHLAHSAVDSTQKYSMPCTGSEIDWRPALAAIINARGAGVDTGIVARAFHLGLAEAVSELIARLASSSNLDTAVLSGGVFQNDLLVRDIQAALGRQRASDRVELWLNKNVPSNDGGLSLGQAALAALTTPAL